MSSPSPIKRRCRRCILSDAFPDIHFDHEGICNYCRRQEKVHNEGRDPSQLRAKIEAAVSRVRSNKENGNYDVLLCFSGGKDSAYVLKLLVQHYRLRVLTFTMDNGFLSSQVWGNIQRVNDALHVDHITIRPNHRFMSRLYREAALGDIFQGESLKRASAVCTACRMTFIPIALRLALEKQIPLIAIGLSAGQTPEGAVVYPADSHVLRDARSSLLTQLEAAVGPEVRLFMQLPDPEGRRSSPPPSFICPLAVEQLEERQILKELREMGWQPPPDTGSCSTNCRINDLAVRHHRRRYGFHPYEHELAQLVRQGVMTREEALEKLADEGNVDAVREMAARLGLDDQTIRLQLGIEPSLEETT